MDKKGKGRHRQIRGSHCRRDRQALKTRRWRPLTQRKEQSCLQKIKSIDAEWSLRDWFELVTYYWLDSTSPERRLGTRIGQDRALKKCLFVRSNLD